MNKEDMGVQKVSSLLIKLSVPAMIGMLVNAIYNIVDRMFIGNAPGLGAIGLAGITISFPVTLVLMAFSLMAGVGGATRFSIALGQKKETEAKKFQGNALALTVIFGLLFMILGNLFMDPLLRVLGASEEVLPYAADYLSVVLFGAVFQCIAMCGNNFSRAQGNARNAMVSQLIGAGFNILFDYILIMQLGIGMKGAAYATIGGQFLSMIWQLFFLFGKRPMIPCELSDLKIDLSYIRIIMKTGLPIFLMQLSSSILNIVINGTLGTYGGDTAISTVGIIIGVQTLLFMPLNGLAQGQQPLISYNYGSKQYDRVRQTLIYTSVVSTVMVLCSYVVVQCFPETIISFFNQEPEILELGKKGLRLWFLCLPVVGCQIMWANFFQSIGKVKEASFLNLLRQFILLIPLVLILPKFFGLVGVFMAVPIADLCSIIITGILFRTEIRRLKAEGHMA